MINLQTTFTMNRNFSEDTGYFFGWYISDYLTETGFDDVKNLDGIIDGLLLEDGIETRYELLFNCFNEDNGLINKNVLEDIVGGEIDTEIIGYLKQQDHNQQEIYNFVKKFEHIKDYETDTVLELKDLYKYLDFEDESNLSIKM